MRRVISGPAAFDNSFNDLITNVLGVSPIQPPPRSSTPESHDPSGTGGEHGKLGTLEQAQRLYNGVGVIKRGVSGSGRGGQFLRCPSFHP